MVRLVIWRRLFRRRSKKTPKLRVTGPCAGHRWIPRTNDQWRGKCFHLMTSSWVAGGGAKDSRDVTSPSASDNTNLSVRSRFMWDFPRLYISNMENWAIVPARAQFEIHRLRSCSIESSIWLVSVAIACPMEAGFFSPVLYLAQCLNTLVKQLLAVVSKTQMSWVRLPHLITQSCLLDRDSHRFSCTCAHLVWKNELAQGKWPPSAWTKILAM